MMIYSSIADENDISFIQYVYLFRFLMLLIKHYIYSFIIFICVGVRASKNKKEITLLNFEFEVFNIFKHRFIISLVYFLFCAPFSYRVHVKNHTIFARLCFFLLLIICFNFFFFVFLQ